MYSLLIFIFRESNFKTFLIDFYKINVNKSTIEDKREIYDKWKQKLAL